jgi:nicotinamide riboside transporter PnuC
MLLLNCVGCVGTVVALAGVWLNNKRRRSCFLLWLLSNSLALAVHLGTGIWPMAVRDVAFLALAMHGWRSWSRAAADGDEDSKAMKTTD